MRTRLLAPRDGAGGVREQLRVVLDLAEVCRVVVGDTNLITTVGSIKVRVAHRHICTENAHQRQQRLALQRSEEHTSELQSLTNLVCRLLLEKKKKAKNE